MSRKGVLASTVLYVVFMFIQFALIDDDPLGWQIAKALLAGVFWFVLWTLLLRTAWFRRVMARGEERRQRGRRLIGRSTARRRRGRRVDE